MWNYKLNYAFIDLQEQKYLIENKLQIFAIHTHTLFKINHNQLVYMFDTPGVLEPSFKDIETGLKLAALSKLFYFLI